MSLSRRRFVGGVVAALGYAGLRPTDLLAGQAAARGSAQPPDPNVIRLSSNENPYGPPDSVMEAMNSAWKWANKYGVPDGGLMDALQEHHGVKADNILLGAGSGEILDVVANTFLEGGKKVLGIEPTYGSVFRQASTIKSEGIMLSLNDDYTQSIPALIETANARAAEIGLIYLCNPNNPTGMVVPKEEVKQLLDGIPQDMVVLVDEAYHHFVDTPRYATSIPYVLEGRSVVISRTFSKIAGLAAMRMGYALASAPLIARMSPHSTGSQNVLVKFGAAAALKDIASQERVKALNIQVRNTTTAALKAYGYDVIPSEANFFMVHLRRDVRPVIQAFAEHNILVGRPFPPMNQHMRVSVGTAEEMETFMTAFKAIMPAGTAATSAG